jgi:hypothetical protein
MQAKRVLDYVPSPNQFDLVTDRWDAQGIRTIHNKYRKFIVSGAEYYERPVNSGNLWHENNQPAGRVNLEFNEKGHIVSKVFDHSAPHIAYTPAPSGAEKMKMDFDVLQEKYAAAQAELEAIKGERGGHKIKFKGQE